MDIDMALYYLYKKKKSKKKRIRRYWVHPTLILREEKGEFKNLIAELREDGERFFTYFRMSPSVFDELLEILGNRLHKRSTNFRKSICPAERLAITLR